MEKKSRRSFLQTLAIIPGLAMVPALLTRGLKNEAMATTGTFEPSYVRLHRTGEFRARGELLWEQMRQCTFVRACARRTGSAVNGAIAGQMLTSRFHQHSLILVRSPN